MRQFTRSDDGKRPVFYRVLTDPFMRIKSHTMLEWDMSRGGDRAGPFIAPHLPSIGIKLTSMGSGFPRDAPPDRIVFEHDPKRPLRDVEGGGNFWIISDAARSVLLQHAASSIDLAPADVFVRRNGVDEPAGPRWLCDVIRFEDVVDEGASIIDWEANHLMYSIGTKYIFKSDVPDDLHLFRLWKAPGVIACSQRLRDAIKAAKLTGMALKDLGKGWA